MTETRKRKTESVEDLDAKIREMEAELTEGHGRPLTWDEVTSTTAEEMAAKEQRRGILPRLIQAAKVKRKEVELRDRQQEVRNKAHGAWTIHLSAVQSADGRAERTARELAELKGGAVSDADHEARREHRDRERAAGEAFQKVLREKLEAPLRVEDLLPRSNTDERGDDAA